MHIWHFFSALFPKKACACANACTSFHASSCLFKLLASFNWIWLKSSHGRNIAGCIEVVRWGKAGDPSVPSVKDNPREELQQLLGRREYTWDKSIFPAVGISEAQPTLVLRTMTEIQIHRKPRFLHLTAYKDSFWLPPFQEIGWLNKWRHGTSLTGERRNAKTHTKTETQGYTSESKQWMCVGWYRIATGWVQTIWIFGIKVKP